MNVYMSVDIEGITGVVHRDMMSPGEREYDRGRRLMTADANAAIEGLVQAGADYILVNDGHGPMRNLLFEEMHPAAHLLTGSGDAKDHCQIELANSRPFAAAVFVGYHAMARTPKAIAPHTIAGAAVSLSLACQVLGGPTNDRSIRGREMTITHRQNPPTPLRLSMRWISIAA